VHVLGLRIQDAQLVEEAIELGLGKRVGALELDRVLRRQDEERRRQLVRCVFGVARLISSASRMLV